MNKSTIIIIALFITVGVLLTYLCRKNPEITFQNCDASTRECVENISWTDLSIGYVKVDKTSFAVLPISSNKVLTSTYMASLAIGSIQKGALVPYRYRQTIFTNNYILIELGHEIQCGKQFENIIDQPYYQFPVIVAVERNTLNAEIYYAQFDKRWNSNMNLKDYLKIIGKT